MSKQSSLFQVAGVLALIEGITLIISIGWLILPLVFVIPIVVAGVKYIKYANFTDEELKKIHSSIVLWGVYLIFTCIISGILGLVAANQIVNYQENALTYNSTGTNRENVKQEETVNNKQSKTEQDIINEKIERLNSLRERNIIDDQEYEDLKNKILNQSDLND